MSFDELGYLINMGETPSIEDFILLCGTFTALLAFILWCCFPLNQKDAKSQQFSQCKTSQHNYNNPSYQTNPKHYSIKTDSYYYT